MKAGELQEHITATYVIVRYGMAALALAFPLLLWIGGRILADLPLQGSMSAYYHSGGGAMRDGFVGILFAVGALLCLYKGYTVFENYALNLAGIFAIGVAIFPMEWGCGAGCKTFTLHGTLAVLFFLCIAYVCIFRACDTLKLVPDRAKARRFKTIYHLLGWGMIVLPLAAVLLTNMLQALAGSAIFAVEASAAAVFAVYWLLKSREIAHTDAERLAREGKLATESYSPLDVFKQIPVDHASVLRKQRTSYYQAVEKGREHM